MIQLTNAHLTQINVREYRRDNQKWTIQKNRQHWAHKTKKNTTQHVLHSTIRKQKTNNANKTRALLQTSITQLSHSLMPINPEIQDIKIKLPIYHFSGQLHYQIME